MITETCDVVVVGAGPAGLAAALAAKGNGAKRVLVVERDENLGGILQQCIHPGFGLAYFNEELTGPEYAQRFIDKAKEAQIGFLLKTTALHFQDGCLHCCNTAGMLRVETGAVVLAMGCRERTRANIRIPGSRPAGIYTAGTAQRLLNVQGHMVGKNIVILGSGDIGMIMARRMTLEGATVHAVVELMPYLTGLMRNKVQCLDDYSIPLMLSHTIVDITGVDRVESVTIAPVDENRTPILEKSQSLPCDTLLLSVGLIPENELSKTGAVALNAVTQGAEVDQHMQTATPGIFACGNVLHVNDLVDNVSRESEIAGKYAALYARGQLLGGSSAKTVAGANVRYVCPQRVEKNGAEDVTLYFRVQNPQKPAELVATSGNRELCRKKALAVSPGEIESLCILQEQLASLGDDIKVEVR